MGKIFRWVIVPVLLAVLFLPQTLARTYTITDGERVVTYTTFATDPEAAALRYLYRPGGFGHHREPGQARFCLLPGAGADRFCRGGNGGAAA